MTEQQEQAPLLHNNSIPIPSDDMPRESESKAGGGYEVCCFPAPCLEKVGEDRPWVGRLFRRKEAVSV